MATPGLLLKSQRNEVFLAVQASGLEPNSFEWENALSEHDSHHAVSLLRHTPTASYFHFDLTAGGNHWCRYAPGSDTASHAATPGSWNQQVAHVGQWLAYLKRETEAPDLWATLSGGSTLSAATAPGQASENTPFSPAERSRIEGSLAQIRGFLVASHVSRDALEQIDTRLAYLGEASERLGRKDWLNVALSVVVNIILLAAVPPDTARSILEMAGNALAWVLGGSPLLPKSLQ